MTFWPRKLAEIGKIFVLITKHSYYDWMTVHFWSSKGWYTMELFLKPVWQVNSGYIINLHSICGLKSVNWTFYKFFFFNIWYENRVMWLALHSIKYWMFILLIRLTTFKSSTFSVVFRKLDDSHSSKKMSKVDAIGSFR